jgi:hypothetical protein
MTPENARPEATDETVNMTIPMRYNFFFPLMSLSLPTQRRKTATTSRYELPIHPAMTEERLRSDDIAGIAMFIADAVNVVMNETIDVLISMLVLDECEIMNEVRKIFLSFCKKLRGPHSVNRFRCVFCKPVILGV